MRFGVYLNQYCHPSGQRVWPEILAQAREAEAMGYDLIALGERHLWPPGFQEMLTALAALAVATQRIRIAAAGFILPIHHPFHLAEQFAAIQEIAEGRMIFGAVLGYRPEELALAEVEPATRAGRLEEALTIIRRLWRGERFDFDGCYFRFRDIFLSPVPQPMPPVWIGAHAPVAIRRAARLADGWIASSAVPWDELPQKIALYRTACAEAGRAPGYVILMRDGFLATTEEEARAIYARPLLDLYAGYADWKRTSPEADRYAPKAFDTLLDRLVFGDVAICREQVARAQAMGVDTLLLRVQPPGVSHAATLDCLRLFAEQVIPHFRD